MSGSTSLNADASEIAVLRRKCQFLTRMVVGLFILWLAMALAHFASLAHASSSTRSSTTPPASRVDSLQVRELVVVDATGTPRVRIGAPLPEPLMMGRRFKRGETVSGVMLYDSEGNERGGYCTDEERNAFLTLDEINRQAVALGVNDRGEMHFALGNGRGGYIGMGVVPSGAWLRLDAPGQPPTLLPTPKEGAPK
jgi:hypothetical protein